MTAQVDLFEGPQDPPSPRKPALQSTRLLSFGKYKDQPYEVLLQDSAYALWLMSSMYAKLQTSHPELLGFLVNRYGQPDRTPAHNKLQNQFLDELFCMRFALASSSVMRATAKRLSEATLNVETVWRKRVHELLGGKALLSEMETRDENEKHSTGRLAAARTALLFEGSRIRVHGAQGKADTDGFCASASISGLVLEEQGADVRFRLTLGYSITTTLHVSYRNRDRPDDIQLDGLGEGQLFRVEVKPVLGDDYPAVLRAMKAVGSTELLVGEYTGFGATWAEVVKVFGLSKIQAVLVSELDDVSLPAVFQSLQVVPLSPEEAQAIVEQEFAKQTVAMAEALKRL